MEVAEIDLEVDAEVVEEKEEKEKKENNSDKSNNPHLAGGELSMIIITTTWNHPYG